MSIKKIAATALGSIIAFSAIWSCTGQVSGFNDAELALIHNADSIMRVLTIEDAADSAVLRASSSDLSAEAILSPDYKRLAELMVATVTHPSQEGVGIAGPQVGINRRVVAVQRFDKEPVLRDGRLDYPFEVYPNIRIVWASDSLAAGPEGCLSVPDRRGDVMRSQKIVIEYADLKSPHADYELPGSQSDTEPSPHNQTGHHPHIQTEHSPDIQNEHSPHIQMVRDTVCDFTAVIFQHEIDHLDGVLYIDRL